MRSKVLTDSIHVSNATVVRDAHDLNALLLTYTEQRIQVVLARQTMAFAAVSLAIA
jgi:hypothetical protein